MKILALDVGNSHTTTCLLDVASAKHTFDRMKTRAQELHDAVLSCAPDRVVLEIGPTAGWIFDLVKGLGIPVEVANPNHEGWRWRKVKRKTDRTDALKLAQLSAMQQLPTVYMPSRNVRQWRTLIRYRHKLMDRRVAVKGQIRSILHRECIDWPGGKSGWTNAALEELASISVPLDELPLDQLWRGQLFLALEELRSVNELLKAIDKKLDAVAEADNRVRRLKTIPGVGTRLAEMVVAMIDDPRRFRAGKQVASYAGLVPKQLESGNLRIAGRISKQGESLLRKFLVEVSWLGLQHNSWVRDSYHRIRRGTPNRNKLAIIAVARRLLIRCWIMLRDDKNWTTPLTASM